MNKETFNPDWLSPPGRTIADLIEQRGLSRKEFAKKTGLPLEKVHRLMTGALAITDDVANILVKTLGGSVDFWCAREEQYRDAIARLQSVGDERAAKAWLSELPMRDMKKFGWIITKLELIKLSVKLGVSRGIVVGQLQHMKRLAPDKFNWLKRRFNWNQIETD